MKLRPFDEAKSAADPKDSGRTTYEKELKYSLESTIGDRKANRSGV